MPRVPAFAVFLAFAAVLAGPVPARAVPAYNEAGVDFPLDGGAVLSYARMWKMNRYVHVGAEIGGGRIVRDFEVDAGGNRFEVETDALVLPFVGPRLGLHFPVVAISLGWSVFRADVDIAARAAGVGTLTGQEKGWGTVLRSPFLVLDFYDKRRRMVFGFGVGGFFGTSFTDLTASSGASRLVTDAHPLDTLTLHLRMLWGDRRSGRTDEF